MLNSADVGSIDRVVRIVIGPVPIAPPFVPGSSPREGALARRLVPIIGPALVATAPVHLCPLRRLTGTSTCPIRSARDRRPPRGSSAGLPPAIMPNRQPLRDDIS